MSYKELVRSMEGERKPGTGYNLTIAALLFLSGIISAMILCQGCNTIPKALNGMGQDLQVLGTGMEAMTNKQQTIGGFQFTPNGMDTMMLDKEGF